MKQKWVIGIAAVVALAASSTVAVLLVRGSAVKDSKEAGDTHVRATVAGTDTDLSTRITNTFNVVRACNVLALSDAQRVLGREAEASANNAIGTTEINGISTSSCGYAVGADNVNDIVTVYLMVRAAQNKAGAIANENEFSMLKAAGATAVPGYGDAAYWDQQRGQLNIKVENNWYSISNMKGSRSGTGTLQQSKAVADQIIEKL